MSHVFLLVLPHHSSKIATLVVLGYVSAFLGMSLLRKARTQHILGLV